MHRFIADLLARLRDEWQINVAEFDYFAASEHKVALLINFGRPRLEWKRLFPPKHIQARRTWGLPPKA